jgi:hypothetical protein
MLQGHDIWISQAVGLRQPRLTFGSKLVGQARAPANRLNSISQHHQHRAMT